MVSLRSFSLTILGPFQLWSLLLLQDLRMCSFQEITVGGPGLRIEPEFIQITGGKTLTLNCTLTQMDLPTTAKWYKELSNDPKLTYRERYQVSRGVRLAPGSRTDFSISLSNMEPDDNGTYRCFTINKVLQRGESNLTKEVAVYVIVPPTVRLETDPLSPIQLNTSVTVTCNAEYFYPNVAKVDLFCKNPSGKGKSARATLNANGTYSRQSSLEIIATENWNASLFTCLVKHNSTVFKATRRLFIKTELGEGSLQRSMMGLYLGLFLNKTGLFFFFASLFKMKARGSCLARPFDPSSQG
ncbi:tyrosine-protein phosphatase non-receptor type substrate 1-like [Pseudonaja textilis]|uniref:tyrosine-protein phosphatase non-receptor type substrate 1-like n=1 Tax=Pseudonaja textilis TaxID=8673 RepID=UPI000EA8D518|nr:tyrosine-protein phosphatase non-receptor type substrate 1-like [Pseudonaja textilis]